MSSSDGIVTEETVGGGGGTMYRRKIRLKYGSNLEFGAANFDTKCSYSGMAAPAESFQKIMQ